MNILFKFEGFSRLRQCWNLLTKGYVMMTLSDESIKSIIREYNLQSVHVDDIIR